MSDLIQAEKIDLEYLKEYEQVVPVNNYILCELRDKNTETLLKSGLIVKTEAVNNTRPYLQVVSVAESLSANKVVDIRKGDIIETSGGQINYFYGKNNERFVLVPVTSISGVFHKSK